MSNPLVPQGVLNRIRGSVTWNDLPQLNITAPYLGKAGITFLLGGEATTVIPTMTGTALSPEPYQLVTVTAAVLKTNGLAQLYQAQQQASTVLGNGVVWPDTTALAPYGVMNCAIIGVRELPFNGESVDYGVIIGGYWPINALLWSS